VATPKEREDNMFRKKPGEIEAWVNIKGVVFPLTLYGNIREEKPFFRHIVEIEEARYSINTELLLTMKSPSEDEFEQALIAMRGDQHEDD
jgi:hypothetical protein